MSSRHISPIRLHGVSSVSRLKVLWEHSAPTKTQQVCFQIILNYENSSVQVVLKFCFSWERLHITLLLPYLKVKLYQK